MVKEGERCILSGFKYRFPACLYDYLIIYAAKTLGLVLNDMIKTRSPREIVTGIKPDFCKDLSVKFEILAYSGSPRQSNKKI
jgi:hypothetical protein